jgi:GTPase SAR1 family protein
MIQKSYKQNKTEVMELYKQYVEFCNKSAVSIDKSIQEQAEKIESEVFNLMVLGEAKSGKSTFINAFLGDEVVPMDVRQCTSAIIEINRGPEFTLTAHKAGGGKVYLDKKEEINNFLRQNAAISNKYRNIPVTSINNELLIGKGGRPIPQLAMKQFIENHAKDNISNLDQDVYNQQIRDYVTETLPRWGELITKIEITYPLSENMQGITIIDSPGVGAGGNVGKIAEDYINKASAIIFVKSLNGQALESSSFMNFMRTNCPKRQKDTLFLVLTGKGNLNALDYQSLMEQAKEMYGKDINPEKIIGIDSLAALMENKCRKLETMEKINEFLMELYENGNAYIPVNMAWMMAKCDTDAFYEKTADISNFNRVRNAIETFAQGANYIRLIGFLNSLKREYSRQQKNLRGIIETSRSTLNDPVALEDQITKKKLEIVNVYNKISFGIDAIRAKYTDPVGGDGIIEAEAEKRKKQYEDIIKSYGDIKDADATTFNSLKTVTMDTVDDSKTFQQEIGKRVIEECNKKLIQYDDAVSHISAEGFMPNFTESDFESYNKAAEKANTYYKDVTTGVTFQKTEQKCYYYSSWHIQTLVKDICNRLDNIVECMKDNAADYVHTCCEAYKEKLTVHRDELQKAYDELLALRDDNEKRLQDIETKEAQLDVIGKEMAELDRAKEVLQNYVKH